MLVCIISGVILRFALSGKGGGGMRGMRGGHFGHICMNLMWQLLHWKLTDKVISLFKCSISIY